MIALDLGWRGDPADIVAAEPDRRGLVNLIATLTPTPRHGQPVAPGFWTVVTMTVVTMMTMTMVTMMTMTMVTMMSMTVVIMTVVTMMAMTVVTMTTRRPSESGPARHSAHDDGCESTRDSSRERSGHEHDGR